MLKTPRVIEAMYSASHCAPGVDRVWIHTSRKAAARSKYDTVAHRFVPDVLVDLPSFERNTRRERSWPRALHHASALRSYQESCPWDSVAFILFSMTTNADLFAT